MGCSSSREEEPPPPAALNRKRASVSAQGGIDPSKVVLNLEALPKVPKPDDAIARIRNCIAKNVLCKALKDEHKDALVAAMKEVRAKAGDKVITQGQLGDNWYVVDDGSLEVYKRTDPADTTDGAKVNSYTTGDSFGELALMYNQRRAASVVCTQDCILWAVDQTTFRALMYVLRTVPASCSTASACALDASSDECGFPSQVDCIHDQQNPVLMIVCTVPRSASATLQVALRTTACP